MNNVRYDALNLVLQQGPSPFFKVCRCSSFDADTPLSSLFSSLKGGLATGKALRSCPADYAGALMFVKGDEVVLLEDGPEGTWVSRPQVPDPRDASPTATDKSYTCVCAGLAPLGMVRRCHGSLQALSRRLPYSPYLAFALVRPELADLTNRWTRAHQIPSRDTTELLVGLLARFARLARLVVHLCSHGRE